MPGGFVTEDKFNDISADVRALKKQVFFYERVEGTSIDQEDLAIRE